MPKIFESNVEIINFRRYKHKIIIFNLTFLESDYSKLKMKVYFSIKKTYPFDLIKKYFEADKFLTYSVFF